MLFVSNEVMESHEVLNWLTGFREENSAITGHDRTSITDHGI
jgi:hypothetical protein